MRRLLRSCLGSVGLKTASGAAPPPRRVGSAVERACPSPTQSRRIRARMAASRLGRDRACAARGRRRHRPESQGPPWGASGPAWGGCATTCRGRGGRCPLSRGVTLEVPATAARRADPLGGLFLEGAPQLQAARGAEKSAATARRAEGRWFAGVFGIPLAGRCVSRVTMLRGPALERGYRRGLRPPRGPLGGPDPREGRRSRGPRGHAQERRPRWGERPFR